MSQLTRPKLVNCVRPFCGAMRLAYIPGADYVGRTFPNIAKFQASRPDLQGSVLCKDNQVLAGLLEASYGDYLYQRITEEYRSLSNPDRLAYAWVSLATVASWWYNRGPVTRAIT